VTISGAIARRPTSIGHSRRAWPCRFVWANYSGLSAETGTRRDLKHLFQQFQPFNRCTPFKPSELKPFAFALFLPRQFPGRLRGQGEIADRSGHNISFYFISANLKDFLPRFLILRKLSDVVDGQHVRRRGPDFFQGFHFGMSRSFTRLGVSLLSFFTDGPTNPE
jgi:hypothetical protein